MYISKISLSLVKLYGFYKRGKEKKLKSDELLQPCLLSLFFILAKS